MKKRFLFITLVLVLLLTAILPAGVMASDKDRDRDKFTAEAMVYISAAGTTTITGQRGPLVFTQTTGEQLTGLVSSSPDWEDLTGSGFTMDVVTNNAILNYNTLTLTGISTGTISLLGADGTSAMTGIFRAIIRGKFMLDEQGNPLFYEVNDLATFKLEGVSGVFDEVEAKGIASVQLTPTPDGQTLAGMMTMEGRLDD